MKERTMNNIFKNKAVSANPYNLEVARHIYRVSPTDQIYNQLHVGQMNKLHNRGTEFNNVDNIQKSLEEMNALEYLPIVVGKGLNIVDGQNRYIAAQQAGEDIYLVFTADGVDDQALMLLLNTGPVYKWKLGNYVDFWAHADDAYKNFKACRITYPEINPSMMVSVFMGVNYRLRGHEMHGFKEGHLGTQMEKRGMNMQKVYHTLSQMYLLQGAPTNPTLSKKVFKLQNLQLALLRVLSDPELDYADFIKKIRKTPHNLESLRTADQIEQEIYDISYRRKA
jgi:hypothetical protein